MQVLDEEKRRRIQEAAADLFTERPFHEVVLEEVATRAGIGKGTLYLYFKSKEELYLAVLYEGFAALVDELTAELGREQHDPPEALRILVRRFVAYAGRHPHLYMLSPGRVVSGSRPQWMNKRAELVGLVERTIRRGVRAGLWRDRHPEWTAQYLTGMVRSVLLYGTGGAGRGALGNHICRLLEAALAGDGAASD